MYPKQYVVQFQSVSGVDKIVRVDADSVQQALDKAKNQLVNGTLIRSVARIPGSYGGMAEVQPVEWVEPIERGHWRVVEQ